MNALVSKVKWQLISLNIDHVHDSISKLSSSFFFFFFLVARINSFRMVKTPRMRIASDKHAANINKRGLVTVIVGKSLYLLLFSFI